MTCCVISEKSLQHSLFLKLSLPKQPQRNIEKSKEGITSNACYFVNEHQNKKSNPKPQTPNNSKNTPNTTKFLSGLPSGLIRISSSFLDLSQCPRTINKVVIVMTQARLPKQAWKVDGDAMNDLYHLKCYLTVFLPSDQDKRKKREKQLKNIFSFCTFKIIPFF